MGIEPDHKKTCLMLFQKAHRAFRADCASNNLWFCLIKLIEPFLPPQRSCGKVMFLHLSLSHSVHKWGACMAGGMCAGWGVHGREHVWGACMLKGGMHA